MRYSPETGAFTGPLTTTKKLAPDTLYWIRVREADNPWSPTHHPFRTPPAL